MNKITGKISTTPIIKGSAKTINEYTGNGVIPGVYIKEEKDPTVPDCVKNITEEDINKWNNPEVDNDYNKATNKPSINGVTLEGNKTTEDLGIQAGSDIELITEILPESIEEDLEENQVYNGNAIHDLARLFGMTLEEVKETIPKPIFDMSCDISLVKMTVTNVTNYSQEIIEKKNQGYLVRLNCNFIENPRLNVVVILNVVDGNWTFFYPVIRGDIGQGTKNYIFRLGIGENNATIEAHDLSGSVDVLTEFDIEKTYEDNQVYNANAIHQLLELFVYEITMIQEGFEELNDRMSELEQHLDDYIDTYITQAIGGAY